MNRSILFILITTLIVTAAGCSFNLPAEIKEFSLEQEIEVKSIISDVSETEIKSCLETLNVNRSVFHPQNQIAAVENFLVGYFESLGYTVSLQPVYCSAVHPYTSIEDDYLMNNIIAEKEGTEADLGEIIIGAHWDSLPTPYTPVTEYTGMNDNASGVSGVLELARVFSSIQLKRTVQFICFAFEEEGLLGSEHYASAMNNSPFLMINMDGIGDTSEKPAEFIGGDILLGLKDHGRFIMAAVEEENYLLGIDFAHKSELYNPDLEYDVSLLSETFDNNPLLGIFSRSDHTPFMLRGIPTVNFLVPSESAVELYHTVFDTLDVLDIPFMAEVIKSIAAFIYSQAIEG